ncbi:hypothetical protein BSL78_27036 [Apostichopus japonicus]|uniref:Uncharacterized protein n=1 Tax=Stichopus japonicus TaxID=307972 RepID=A0A2G8JK64_STIJA|nr:hypothetical protein BSL78_27036 [Apostichopus japonicus]
MVYGSATMHLVMSPGTRGLRYLRADSKPLAPAGFRSWESHVINRFVSPILWYPGAVYQFRVASWCGWRGRFFIHMVWWYRACQEGGIVPKTGEGGLGVVHLGTGPRSQFLRDRALNAIFVQGRHPVEVWRSVHSRLNGCRLRDLAWRIAHGALVTNLKSITGDWVMDCARGPAVTA